MKVILMAGGVGARLRPLTSECPKPMVPLCGKPVMAWTVEWLSNQGLNEQIVTCAYLHEKIRDHFGTGSRYSVSMDYAIETQPLGTAGSVKAAAGRIDDVFAVVSGDGLTDVDLLKAIDFHKRSGALASMLLKRVETPMEYGVVVCDGRGRVEAFVEKPGWSRAYSDTINTGIYILEREVLSEIPEGPYDFGKELFPALVARGAPVYASVVDGYWCDIGDPGTYLRAHADILEGRVKVKLDAARIGNVWLEQGAILGDAQVEGVCYLGRGARVEDGARLGPHTVLGDEAVLGARATARGSVLWQRARLDGDADRSLILDGARVAPGAKVLQDAIVGARAEIGAYATVYPGMRVWPDQRIPAGAAVQRPVQSGALVYGELGIGARIQDWTPTMAADLGAALEGGLRDGEQLVGYDGHAAAGALAQALASGAQWSGARVSMLSGCTMPEAGRALRALAIPAGAHVSVKDDWIWITPLSQDGAPVSSSALRKMVSTQREGTARSPGRMKNIDAGGVADAAIRALMQRPILDEPPDVVVFSRDAFLLERTRALFRDSGIEITAHRVSKAQAYAPEGGVGIYLSSDGSRFTPFDGGGSIDKASWPLVCALLLGRRFPGARFPVCGEDTSRLLAWCEALGLEPVQIPGAPDDYRRHLLGASDPPTVYLAALRCDAVAGSLLFVDALSASGETVTSLKAMLPPIHMRWLDIACVDAEKSRILSRLRYPSVQGAEKRGESQSGIKWQHPSGWAWILPADDQPTCRIICEGANAEIADELGIAYGDLVKSLSGGDKVKR